MSNIKTIISLMPTKLTRVITEESFEGAPCDCPRCNGEGEVWVDDYSCKDYAGRRICDRYCVPCKDCNGTGKLVPHVTITWKPLPEGKV